MGAGCYAVNAQVFCKVDAVGNYLAPESFPRLGSSFGDGTSNTILAGEKYAECNNRGREEGGSLWAYWLVDEANLQPYHAGFAISWYPSHIGPSSRFQVRPSPFVGDYSECSQFLASTSHFGGMQTLFADASVRTLSPGISGDSWWAACTPNGGEVARD